MKLIRLIVVFALLVGTSTMADEIDDGVLAREAGHNVALF